jgi:4-amino-4-deoxy-L-arabinose transferase-like glycosyltransferase
MDVQNGLRKPFAARFLMPAGWLRGELPALLLLFAFTVAYRAYFMRFYDVMSADGTSYASAGKAFFQSFDPRVFGTVMPPLYSLFIGLCNLLTDDLEMASRLVSVIFSSLTIFPLYLMGRGFFGRIAAAAAVLLFATLPFIHGMSGIDIAEPIYTFFAFSGAYLGWRAYNRKKIWPMGGAGALLALAYLARPEGFVLLVAFTLLYAGLELMAGKWRTAGPLLCVFWLGFFIVAFPYLHQLHDTTGKWQLSGKTSINTNIIKE